MTGLSLHDLPNILPYVTQHHVPRDVNTRKELGPATSIVNPENAPDRLAHSTIQ